MTHAVKPVRERFATKGLAAPVVARAAPSATSGPPAGCWRQTTAPQPLRSPGRRDLLRCSDVPARTREGGSPLRGSEVCDSLCICRGSAGPAPLRFRVNGAGACRVRSSSVPPPLAGSGASTGPSKTARLPMQSRFGDADRHGPAGQARRFVSRDRDVALCAGSL